MRRVANLNVVVFMHLRSIGSEPKLERITVSFQLMIFLSLFD